MIDHNELTRLADEMHIASPAGTDVHWKILRRFSDRLRTLALGAKPAGNAIDGLLATARPYLAEELLINLGYTWDVDRQWVAPYRSPNGGLPFTTDVQCCESPETCPEPCDPPDKRPSSCRERLRAEGKPYPRSGCDVCKTGGMKGCPYEHHARQ